MSQSLLKLQIAPVQEFIAQARSTRDLWSGSYLLSWLMAAGAAALVKEMGNKASAVISPRLVGQPLFDLHQEIQNLRDQLIKLNKPLFAAPPSGRTPLLAGHRSEDLLTPNFTNILIAQFAADQAPAATRAIVSGIRREWKRVAEACWEKLLSVHLVEPDGWGRDRFSRQLSHFPSITWQLTEVPATKSLDQLLANLPLDRRFLAKLAGARLPDDEPDPFPALVTRNAWQLDAVRQLREFRAWGPGAWTGGDASNEKDSITGREEAVVGGKDWHAKRVGPLIERAKEAASAGQPLKNFLWPILFREGQRDDWFGAIQLIKRLWHWAYLTEVIGLEATHRREPKGEEYPFPSTPQLAIHDPAKNVREDLDEGQAEVTAALKAEEHSPYFAVLAMDGDEMGKWLSGEKTRQGPTREFREDLSERLSNFALRCVRPIVEGCDGRLIVAGGEDVTALLPADTALDCARFLQMAYRGDASFAGELQQLATRLCEHHRGEGYEEPPDKDEKKPEMSAFLVAAKNGTLFAPGSVAGTFLFDPELRPFGSPPSGTASEISLPGGLIAEDGKSLPEISAGIAIAHFKEPLQDVVQAAHDALDMAKKDFDRASIAVTLVKHSGETVNWGCKWASGGVELLGLLQYGCAEGVFSGRLPHRYVEILSRYLIAGSPAVGSAMTDVPGFVVRADEILQRDFEAVLASQRGDASDEVQKKFFQLHQPAEMLKLFLKNLDAQHATAQRKLEALIGLCRVAAFILPAAHSSTFASKASIT
jgi:hypothetical protein